MRQSHSRRLLLVLGVLFAVLGLSPNHAQAACSPAQATPFSMGCQPQVSSVQGTDFVEVWIPGNFPASASLISVANLFMGHGGFGTGTVTSVGLALPNIFTVTGTPVTASGVLTGTLATQSANTIFAGPTTGSATAPSFRSLVSADLPVGSNAAIGGVKCDGVTITCSGGTIASVSGGAGTVVNVGLVMPGIFSVTGSPVTTSGNLTASLASQSANLFFASPNGSPGLPSFRAVVPSDLPLGTTSQFGAVKCDGVTILCSAGVISSTGSGSGSVTSVGLTMPGIFSVSGSPITSAGNLAVTLGSQTAGQVFAAPATISGVPVFRALVASDLPLATTGAFGAVKPDGVTVTISAGVISAVTGGSGNPGGATNSVQINGGGSTFAGVSLTAGQLLVGQSGAPLAETIGGDCTLSALGVLTCTKTSGVPFTSLATIATATVPLGGTGLTAGTSGGVPYFNATNTMASSALLTSHAIVLGGGAGAAPHVLASVGTATTLLHGNVSTDPTFSAVALASDVTGNLPLANMASLGANVVLGTLVTGPPVALSMPSCGGASNALTFVLGTGFGCNTIAGGGGSLTISDGTHSVSSTTSLTFGNGIVVGGSAGAATANLTAPNNTYSSNHTLGASDMGGQSNLNGASLTLTIPAISSTVNAAGMQWVATNQSTTPVTISSTPTINGYIGTVISAGAGIACTSNGVSLDCIAIGTPNNPTTFSIGTVASGTSTINCLVSPYQYLTNGGAFTFAAPATDSSCVIQVENNASAGTITFSGFTQGTNSGDALTTTNTNKFQISVTRIHSISHYLITALQ